MGHAVEGMRVQQRTREVTKLYCATVSFAAMLLVLFLMIAAAAAGQSKTEGGRKSTWHSIEFGIVKFNDQAPNSWNIYHGEKKGLLLVRLWKRYLFVDVAEEEVYDIDPKNIKVSGDAAEWSLADVPDKPIATPEFKERNVGLVQRIQFRLGKDGHLLELQIPLDVTGRPVY
jgi:hypothetical protein